MDADVRASNAALDLYFRRWRCGKADLRVNAVHLRWCGAAECVRNGVLSRITALHMSHSVVRMARCRVVLVSREPVVVLRVIVIGVGVCVQQRRQRIRRNQRRDEQRRQDTVHTVSL
jgi:hypothetical protein